MPSPKAGRSTAARDHAQMLAKRAAKLRAKRDPMEGLIADALTRVGEPFERDTENSARLDFHLPRMGVHIEVKQFHSDRIAVQMGRVDDVIVAQGAKAVRLLAALIEAGIAKVGCGEGPEGLEPLDEGEA